MYRHRGSVPRRPRKNLGQILVKQIILCIIIVLLVILAKKMDIAMVNKAMETFHTQLAKDYTATEIVHTAKSALIQVKDSTRTIVATFREGEKMMEFSPPADVAGTLTASASSSNGGKSMQFQSDKEIQVYASAGGTISEISAVTNQGRYIKISHGNNILSLYGGCSDVYVQPLEKVKKGQIIGTVKAGENQPLTFEIWTDGNLADPTEYIAF